MFTIPPPDPLKAEIDAQSGRFEFLKQCLTLSLAGLAGTAALFTDPTKLPTNWLTVATLGLFGAALVTVAGGSLFGLGAYANLLKNFFDQTEHDIGIRSILKWAGVAFWGVVLAAIAMLAFAVEQVWSFKSEQSVTGAIALDATWKALSNQGCSLQLEQLTQNSSGYIVRYRSESCSKWLIATVSAKDGRIARVASAPIIGARPTSMTAGPQLAPIQPTHRAPDRHRHRRRAAK